MSDRELLEAAAKAAGIVVKSWGAHYDGVPFGLLEGATIPLHWSPLADDGDALRLAVTMQVEIRVFNGKAHAGKTDRFWCTENWFPDGDKFASTRRAIVRAAASRPSL